jgi:hypothetical protein
MLLRLPANNGGMRLSKSNGTNVRTISKFIFAVVLIAAAALESNAQNTVIKLVQDLSFKFTGYYQMSPTENATTFFRHAGKVSFTNKDIINLLEPEVGIIFSSDAKLKLITNIETNTQPKVIVRDRFQGEQFDTDVTQYFAAEVLESVEDTKINKNPLKASGTSYDVIAFVMRVPKASFRVLGFGAVQVKTGKHEGEPTAVVHTGTVNVSGNGDYQVSILGGILPVALTGTVKITGTDLKSMAE